MGNRDRGGPYSSPVFHHLKPTFSGCAFRWAYNHDNALAYYFFSSRFEI
jgi:hypothetical protein